MPWGLARGNVVPCHRLHPTTNDIQQPKHHQPLGRSRQFPSILPSRDIMMLLCQLCSTTGRLIAQHVRIEPIGNFPGVKLSIRELTRADTGRVKFSVLLRFPSVLLYCDNLEFRADSCMKLLVGSASFPAALCSDTVTSVKLSPFYLEALVTAHIKDKDTDFIQGGRGKNKHKHCSSQESNACPIKKRLIAPHIASEALPLKRCIDRLQPISNPPAKLPKNQTTKNVKKS